MGVDSSHIARISMEFGRDGPHRADTAGHRLEARRRCPAVSASFGQRNGWGRGVRVLHLDVRRLNSIAGRSANVPSNTTQECRNVARVSAACAMKRVDTRWRSSRVYILVQAKACVRVVATSHIHFLSVPITYIFALSAEVLHRPRVAPRKTPS